MSETIEKLLPHGGGHQQPTTIVVHCMAAEIDYRGQRHSAWDFLNLVDLPDKPGLSAHILVPSEGPRIRCRADDQIAWHAKGFNTNSLGVEVLVPMVFNLEQLKFKTARPWVSNEQLDSLVQQILIWKKAWPIEKIVRHSDLDPTRKWFDPGEGFPWDELLQRTWI